MRPQKKIDRTPSKAAPSAAQPRKFRKGRSTLPPEDVEVADASSDAVSPLPTAGTAPSKWELRSGRTAVAVPKQPVTVDLREDDAPAVELPASVRTVDGDHYERRSSGFVSKF